MSRVEALVLQAGDEQILRDWTRASSISAGLAKRARILLLAADGHSNVEIGRLVGVSLPTVRLWRGRYRAGGTGALGDLHRSGRPAVHDEVSIIAVTLEPPPANLGVTHWSARLLADHLDTSFATVARIWRRWGLQPWKASDDRIDGALGRDRPAVRGRGLGHLAGDRRRRRAEPGQGQSFDEGHQFVGQPVVPAVGPLPSTQTAHACLAVTGLHRHAATAGEHLAFSPPSSRNAVPRFHRAQISHIT